MALERAAHAGSAPRRRAALFLLCAAAVVALRLWLAARSPRLYEFEHYWTPIARAQAEGRNLWTETDYHFFPPWAWLLGGFEAVARRGADFAAVQRTFLTLVDVGIAALLYRLGTRVPGALSPRVAALAYLANPVAIFVSSIQGQFDGLSLAFLVAAVLATVERGEPRPAPWAGFLLGASVAAKQVTLFHPLLWLARRRGIANVAIAYALPLVTLAPYAGSWRAIARSLLVYYSVPRSYGLSELVLWDSRLGPAVGVLGAAAALATIYWLRGRELTRSCLFLFLVLLFFAPGLGSQYLLWPLPFGALFGGAPYLAFTGASMLWIVGSFYGLPGSGQWMGQLVWLSVGVWMFFESRALGAQTVRRAV
jgi:hypothetical protein